MSGNGTVLQTEKLIRFLAYRFTQASGKSHARDRREERRDPRFTMDEGGLREKSTKDTRSKLLENLAVSRVGNVIEARRAVPSINEYRTRGNRGRAREGAGSKHALGERARIQRDNRCGDVEMAPVERRGRKRPHNFPSDFTLAATDASRDRRRSPRAACHYYRRLRPARLSGSTRVRNFPGWTANARENERYTHRTAQSLRLTMAFLWGGQAEATCHLRRSVESRRERDGGATGRGMGRKKSDSNYRDFLGDEIARASTSTGAEILAIDPTRRKRAASDICAPFVAGALDARDGAVAQPDAAGARIEIHLVAVNVERPILLVVLFARGTFASFGNDRLFRGQRNEITTVLG